MTVIARKAADSAAPEKKDPTPTAPKASLGSRFKKDKVLLLLAVPGILALLVFQYIPLLMNVIAFQDFQPFLGITSSPFVGFDNFRVIFNGDPAFLSALSNTLILTLIQVVFVFPLPIALALLLNSFMSEKWKQTIQSILYLPHFLSWVIVVALFQQMLGNAGLVNTWLRQADMSTFQIIGVPELFHALLTSQIIWKDTGWSTIIFLAAISKVDASLYEAAAIDRAPAWRRMWHITLPAIRPVIVLLLILRLGDSLTVGFEQIILQQVAVGTQVSEVLDTYVYNNGILGGNWGVAAAVGLVKGIVSVALVLGANKIAHLFGERGVYSK
ncbi:ABC transporter permease subunit [Paenarthrobacter sp. OM7]|uniref:ABC transporter permease n=1 Tax=Paenarthrobacter sp. AMU7 TaxID=3162492 RepID=A0AB39YN08_9MICC|nr:ABC transporter permease subunit [Paenarthrobacter sp. OM7]WGM20308.1 ABC transporter permease subunit [Paenarthrobacter sp. OM7]